MVAVYWASKTCCDLSALISFVNTLNSCAVHVVFFRHAFNLSENAVSESVAHLVYFAPHCDSIHLRNALSQLICDAPEIICVDVLLRMSAASRALRCARIWSANALSSDSVDICVPNTELLSWIVWAGVFDSR